MDIEKECDKIEGEIMQASGLDNNQYSIVLLLLI